MKLWNIHKWIPFVAMAFSFPFNSYAQNAAEIVSISEEKVRGVSSFAEIRMTIIRPTWSREIEMKSWSLGDEYGLILITAPVRDKGTAFLKRDKEIWNWQPTIDRTIKLPPSMMMQSWMGSDFTNDDLVKQSSIITDYTHVLLREEEVEGRNCYVIEMTPKEETAVVWGKVITWIDSEEYMQLKTAFYDEDGYLINTMVGSDIKMLGGKLLPARLEVIPEDEPDKRTLIEYINLEFDIDVEKPFFSIQQLKRIR